MSSISGDSGPVRSDKMIRERNRAASLERLSEASGRRRAFPTLARVLEEHHAGFRRLDVGCGVGEMLGLLGPDSVGMDFLGENCQQCYSKGMTVVRADANGFLPVKSGSFDLVLCSHVLEHLRCPLDAVEEFMRVLAERGLFVLCLPTPRGIVRRLVDGYFSDHPSHLYAFDLASIRRLLEIAGFRIVDVELDIPRSDRSRFAKAAQYVMNLNPRLFMWSSSSFWIVAVKG